MDKIFHKVCIRNADIRHITNQQPLSSITESCRDSILHEWLRMRMLDKPSSNLLQRTGGDHLAAAHNLDEVHSLGIHEARDLAQYRPLRRPMSLHSRQCMPLLDISKHLTISLRASKECSRQDESTMLVVWPQQLTFDCCSMLAQSNYSCKAN